MVYGVKISEWEDTGIGYPTKGYPGQVRYDIKRPPQWVEFNHLIRRSHQRIVGYSFSCPMEWKAYGFPSPLVSPFVGDERNLEVSLLAADLLMNSYFDLLTITCNS